MSSTSSTSSLSSSTSSTSSLSSSPPSSPSSSGHSSAAPGAHSGQWWIPPHVSLFYGLWFIVCNILFLNTFIKNKLFCSISDQGHHIFAHLKALTPDSSVISKLWFCTHKNMFSYSKDEREKIYSERSFSTRKGDNLSPAMPSDKKDALRENMATRPS